MSFLANAHISSMDGAFSNCTALKSVDFSGLDLNGASGDIFGRCDRLGTITVDDGYSGGLTFPSNAGSYYYNDSRKWYDDDGGEYDRGSLIPTGIARSYHPYPPHGLVDKSSELDGSDEAGFYEVAYECGNGRLEMVFQRGNGPDELRLQARKTVCSYSKLDETDALRFADCDLARYADKVAFVGGVKPASVRLGGGNLREIDLSGLDTSNITDMSYMFAGCSGLASLDTTGLDTSHAADMHSLFDGCSSLTSLNLSGFDFSHRTPARKPSSSR